MITVHDLIPSTASRITEMVLVSVSFRERGNAIGKEWQRVFRKVSLLLVLNDQRTILTFWAVIYVIIARNMAKSSPELGFTRDESSVIREAFVISIKGGNIR